MVVALGSTNETQKETRESQEVSNLCPTSVQPHFPQITALDWDVQPVQPISIHKVVLIKKGDIGVVYELKAFLETLIGRLDRLDRLDTSAPLCLT